MKISQEMLDFFQEMRNWSEITFGEDDGTGTAKHLAKEALEAAENPKDIMEWADCLMLTTDGAYRAGYSLEQLLEAVVKKFEICKKRKWLPPNAEGIIEHDRSIAE